MTTTSRIRLTGSGWSREIDECNARLLAERLRANDEWGLAFKLSERLGQGGGLVLNKEEKRALFTLLENIRSTSDLPVMLSELCTDLDDDLFGYEQ
jgi:hypothetical protein